jgi:hypothetical protein
MFRGHLYILLIIKVEQTEYLDWQKGFSGDGTHLSPKMIIDPKVAYCFVDE